MPCHTLETYHHSLIAHVGLHLRDLYLMSVFFIMNMSSDVYDLEFI